MSGTKGRKVRRSQTHHQDNYFASAALMTRFATSRVTSGGVWYWDIAALQGTLAWDQDAVIVFPTVVGNVVLAAGDIVGKETSVGDAVYIDLERLISVAGDDPPGTWDPSGDLNLTDADVLTGSDFGEENEMIYIIGVHGPDHRFYMRHHTIIDDGIPTTLGGVQLTTDGYLYEQALGALTINDVGFDFLPDVHGVQVYVNGLRQIPYTATGGPPAGYASATDEADYKEIAGAGAGAPWFRGIEWLNEVPANGEIVFVVSSSGGTGPVGPPGPNSDLQDAYDADPEIELEYSAPSQTAVRLIEVLEAGAILIDGGEYKLYELPDTIKTWALRVQRSTHHPDPACSGSVAFMLLSSGEMGLGGLWIYDLKEYQTLWTAMKGTGPGGAGDSGLFHVGVGQASGAVPPDHKLCFGYIPQAMLGSLSPAELAILRQGGTLKPEMSGGALRGQLAINERGEVASGWGKDFIRWHVIEVALDGTEEPVGSESYRQDLDIDPDIIEPGITFVGGFAGVLDEVSEWKDFVHLNPTTAGVVGTNPAELKLSMSSDQETLRITYGEYLDDMNITIYLAYSSEFDATDERIP